MKQFDTESFFFKLTDDERKLVTARMHKESFSMGQYVFKENDGGERLYVVEKGMVSLIKSIGGDLNKTILLALRDRYSANSASSTAARARRRLLLPARPSFSAWIVKISMP